MRARRQGTQKSSAARGGNARRMRRQRYFHSMPGQDQHHGGDAGEHQRGAQVGLFDDEQHEDHGHDGRAQQRVLPVAHLVEPGVQEPGEKQDETGLAISEG